jgi:hypothetical protein
VHTSSVSALSIAWSNRVSSWAKVSPRRRTSVANCYIGRWRWSPADGITDPGHTLALARDTPEPRAVMNRGRIIALPQTGGLYHRYERVAA